MQVSDISPSSYLIMVNGNGKIIGADRNLRNKFSSGQTLIGTNIRDLLNPIVGEETKKTNLPTSEINRRWCLINTQGDRIYATAATVKVQPSQKHQISVIKITPDKSPLKNIKLITVLAADDSEVIGLTLPRSLERIGIAKKNIVFVQNGRDAIQQAKERAFDLIILDNQMPVPSGERIDGLEAAKKIRAIERELSREPTTILLYSSDIFDRLPPAFDDSMPKSLLGETLKGFVIRHRPPASKQE